MGWIFDGHRRADPVRVHFIFQPSDNIHKVFNIERFFFLAFDGMAALDEDNSLHRQPEMLDIADNEKGDPGPFIFNDAVGGKRRRDSHRLDLLRADIRFGKQCLQRIGGTDGQLMMGCRLFGCFDHPAGCALHQDSVRAGSPGVDSNTIFLHYVLKFIR